MNSTPREVAYSLLYDCQVKKAYSNIAFDSAINRSNLNLEEKRFAAALCYGAIERLITLDAVISSLISKPIDKMKPELRCVLQLGIFQLLYMNSVPDRAAVDESVKLAKRVDRNKASAGFVNAVLRGFIRQGKHLPKGKDRISQLSVEYSCPQWLIHKWLDEYGEDKTLALLTSSVGKPPVTLRVNTLRCSLKQLACRLEEDGFSVQINDALPDCVSVSGGNKAIENCKAYQEGLFHVQDIASQLCCEAVGAVEGDVLLDVCSAPGGKAFTCAELMNGKGRIYAFDLHPKRVSLINSGAKRLGLDNITAEVNNAKIFSSDLPKADKVLCDVVCSGLGVIRRKPEIKYKSPEELKELPEIQYSILSTSAQYVKQGGTLVYSTCTVSKAENEDVVMRFLDSNKDFEAVNVSEMREDMRFPFVTLTPDMYGSDGFFIAKMKRVR